MHKRSLKFLLPSQFSSYDLLNPPGPHNRGGGVGVKYARIEEAGGDAYDCQRISDVQDVGPEDIVFADWLWFCSTGGKSIVDQVKSFIELPSPRCVYGSELCVLTWPQNVLQRLVEHTDLITHNTAYQRNLYEVIGIYNSRFLCDPVPAPAFAPSAQKKRRRLVCMGQISEAKRSDAVVEIFERLEGSEVERCYIGGCMAWGTYYQDKRSGQLHKQIESLSDLFIENATQQEATEIINESSFYAHVSYHDVASSSNQENMAAGNIVFGLMHPVLRERTKYRFAKPEALAEAVVKYPFQTEKHQEAMKQTVSSAADWSYEAWQEQIDAILRLIT